MCLIAIAHRVAPMWPLVIAANRDEFYERPTRGIHAWSDDRRILGGRDLRSGGSWLALRDGGRFAAVTNIRGTTTHSGPSRGMLVANFVRGDDDPFDYVASIPGEDYDGFHLIAGVAGGTIAHVSNARGTPSVIEPGVFAVSNGRPGDDWPKVQLARSFVTDALDDAGRTSVRPGGLTDALLAFLGTRRGGPLEQEVFVATETYGTRSSTVVLVDAHGRVTVTERAWPSGVTTRLATQRA